MVEYFSQEILYCIKAAIRYQSFEIFLQISNLETQHINQIWMVESPLTVSGSSFTSNDFKTVLSKS